MNKLVNFSEDKINTFNPEELLISVSLGDITKEQAEDIINKLSKDNKDLLWLVIKEWINNKPVSSDEKACQDGANKIKDWMKIKLFSRIETLGNRVKNLAEESSKSDESKKSESNESSESNEDKPKPEVKPEDKLDLGEVDTAKYLLCYYDLVQIPATDAVPDIKTNGKIITTTKDDKDNKVVIYLIRNNLAFITTVDGKEIAMTFKDNLGDF